MRILDTPAAVVSVATPAAVLLAFAVGWLLATLSSPLGPHDLFTRTLLRIAVLVLGS